MAFEPTENEKIYESNILKQVKFTSGNKKGQIIPGVFETNRKFSIVDGEECDKFFDGTSKNTNDIFLFLEVNGKRIFAPLNRIKYYKTGAKDVTLDKNKENWAKIKDILVYVDDKGREIPIKNSSISPRVYKKGEVISFERIENAHTNK